IRGWIGYFSHFYKSALYPTLRRIDAHILRWVARKFKRFKERRRGARAWLAQLIRAQPRLFAHWPLLYGHGRVMGAVWAERLTYGCGGARGCDASALLACSCIARPY